MGLVTFDMIEMMALKGEQFSNLVNQGSVKQAVYHIICSMKGDYSPDEPPVTSYIRTLARNYLLRNEGEFFNTDEAKKAHEMIKKQDEAYARQPIIHRNITNDTLSVKPFRLNILRAAPYDFQKPYDQLTQEEIKGILTGKRDCLALGIMSTTKSIDIRKSGLLQYIPLEDRGKTVASADVTSTALDSLSSSIVTLSNNEAVTKDIVGQALKDVRSLFIKSVTSSSSTTSSSSSASAPSSSSYNQNSFLSMKLDLNVRRTLKSTHHPLLDDLRKIYVGEKRSDFSIPVQYLPIDKSSGNSDVVVVLGARFSSQALKRTATSDPTSDSSYFLSIDGLDSSDGLFLRHILSQFKNVILANLLLNGNSTDESHNSDIMKQSVRATISTSTLPKLAVLLGSEVETAFSHGLKNSDDFTFTCINVSSQFLAASNALVPNACSETNVKLVIRNDKNSSQSQFMFLITLPHLHSPQMQVFGKYSLLKNACIELSFSIYGSLTPLMPLQSDGSPHNATEAGVFVIGNEAHRVHCVHAGMAAFATNAQFFYYFLEQAWTQAQFDRNEAYIEELERIDFWIDQGYASVFSSLAFRYILASTDTKESAPLLLLDSSGNFVDSTNAFEKSGDAKSGLRVVLNPSGKFSLKGLKDAMKCQSFASSAGYAVNYYELLKMMAVEKGDNVSILQHLSGQLFLCLSEDEKRLSSLSGVVSGNDIFSKLASKGPLFQSLIMTSLISGLNRENIVKFALSCKVSTSVGDEGKSLSDAKKIVSEQLYNRLPIVLKNLLSELNVNTEYISLVCLGENGTATKSLLVTLLSVISHDVYEKAFNPNVSSSSSTSNADVSKTILNAVPGMQTLFLALGVKAENLSTLLNFQSFEGRFFLNMLMLKQFKLNKGAFLKAVRSKSFDSFTDAFTSTFSNKDKALFSFLGMSSWDVLTYLTVDDNLSSRHVVNTLFNTLAYDEASDLLIKLVDLPCYIRHPNVNIFISDIKREKENKNNSKAENDRGKFLNSFISVLLHSQTLQNDFGKIFAMMSFIIDNKISRTISKTSKSISQTTENIDWMMLRRLLTFENGVWDNRVKFKSKGDYILLKMPEDDFLIKFFQQSHSAEKYRLMRIACVQLSDFSTRANLILTMASDKNCRLTLLRQINDRIEEHNKTAIGLGIIDAFDAKTFLKNNEEEDSTTSTTSMSSAKTNINTIYDGPFSEQVLCMIMGTSVKSDKRLSKNPPRFERVGRLTDADLFKWVSLLEIDQDIKTLTEVPLCCKACDYEGTVLLPNFNPDRLGISHIHSDKDADSVLCRVGDLHGQNHKCPKGISHHQWCARKDGEEDCLTIDGCLQTMCDANIAQSIFRVVTFDKDRKGTIDVERGNKLKL